MTYTPVTVTGNLTRDPELRFTPLGKPVANLTVASTPRVFDRERNEWQDDETTFWPCTIWGNMAENTAESLVKGARVIVTGVIKQRSWTGKDGKKHSRTEIDVQDIGPSLRTVTAKTEKANQGTRGGSSQQSPRDPWEDQPPF